ncbi:hypothetical protein [Flavisolibacter nicotianae]|uniref:hypothetical protein n=1 Tax=Flavisolibacter nicotianae TaxID=2364882 RepID=UPI000EACDF7C|nr:hypothetical protein [Flavisolibacter nicotianae]
MYYKLIIQSDMEMSMSKIYFLNLLLIASVQTSAQYSTPVLVASKIAGKLQDSLGLTALQKKRVFTANMQIYDWKRAAREQFDITDAQLQVKTQEAENKRDSLYKEVLTNAQYLLYKQKKQNLVTNN